MTYLPSPEEKAYAAVAKDLDLSSLYIAGGIVDKRVAKETAPRSYLQIGVDYLNEVKQDPYSLREAQSKIPNTNIGEIVGEVIATRMDSASPPNVDVKREYKHQQSMYFGCGNNCMN